MNGLYRRGGIWWARLVVPENLRALANRREFIRSTRSHDLAVAKLVGSIMLTEWRHQLLKLGGKQLDNQGILNLINGSPILGIGGFLSLERAAGVMAFDVVELLRAAANGKLALHHAISRASGEGFIVPVDSLQLVDPEIGKEAGYVIPDTLLLPSNARPVNYQGKTLPIGLETAVQIANEGLGEIDLLALELVNRPDMWFVPNVCFGLVAVGDLLVPCDELNVLRVSLAAQVSPERIKRAQDAEKNVVDGVDRVSGKWAKKRYLWTLEQYCTDTEGLPGSLNDPAEIEQKRVGMARFAEYMGDLRLCDINADTLREYRKGPLKTFLANINHLPRDLRRATMKQSIERVEASGRCWPVMSADRQHEQMKWLYAFFRWLVEKERISRDVSATVRNETGLTKAQEIEAKRIAKSDEDEGRRPFTGDELKQIFGVMHYQTGNGRHLVKLNAKWYPFQFWLPLLGLCAGMRIKEISQLHLVDVVEIDGVWCLDVNAKTKDKKLKNDNAWRIIPIHQRVKELGFLDYCERLRQQNYRRVFPELTYSRSAARYAKTPILKMSELLLDLGMQRDNTMVFHNLRKNFNDEIGRVAVPGVDARLGAMLRYQITGHELPGAASDANAAHYTRTRIAEKAGMVNAVSFELGTIERFDIAYGIGQVAIAINNKIGSRQGLEDMGPL